MLVGWLVLVKIMLLFGHTAGLSSRPSVAILTKLYKTISMHECVPSKKQKQDQILQGLRLVHVAATEHWP